MIHTGDVIEVLSRLEPEQFDAVLCDPPYGLRFMGKRWDYSVPGVEAWRAILRVLKPGAPMLACGGTRTVHRLVCAIEDAGFEIRDQLVYLHGMGFPKSQRADLAVDAALGVEPITGDRPLTEADITVARAIAASGLGEPSIIPTKSAGSHIGARYAGYGTALKPAHEPIVLARKPLIGTLGANLLAHGTGALNIDGARLGGDPPLRFDITIGIEKDTPGIFGDAISKKRPSNGRPAEHGRWPANVILDEDAAQALDESVLKPAHEPIVLARKPLIGTLGANLLAHGTGALNIDGTRLEGEKPITFQQSPRAAKNAVHFGGFSQNIVPGSMAQSPLGRWPSNVILDELAGEALDEAVGPRDSNPYRANEAPGAVFPMRPRSAGGLRERGLGPSRFFYCAKVSTRERELGCEELPRRSAGEVTGRDDDTAGLDSPRAGAGRVGGARNHHPTLKPLALTEYLAKLLLPPPGRVRRILVPYAGAGSEMIGAYLAGWDEVDGVERDAEYVAIAEARIRRWSAPT